MIDVSVVICTFKRPELLRQALLSCVRQEGLSGVDYEIIVVDNSPDKEGKSAVDGVISETGYPVKYTNELPANISIARNAGIGMATGGHVAFLDDDEVASPRWLCSLLDAAKNFGADIVVGPVEPVFFGGQPPDWDLNARYYTRSRNLITGSTIEMAGIGNSLVNLAACSNDLEMFDPIFGRTGGEDTEFFMRMRNSTKKIIWCAEASVTEFIPETRKNIDYMLRRIHRTAQIYSQCLIKNSRTPFFTAAKRLLMGCAQFFVWLLPRIFFGGRQSEMAVKSRINFAAAVGKIYWWSSKDRD